MVVLCILVLQSLFITVYSGTIITSNGYSGPNNTLLYSEGVPITITCITTDTGQLHWGSSITQNTTYSAIDHVPSESSLDIFSTRLLSVDQKTMISSLNAQNSSAVFGTTVMCWDQINGNLSTVTIQRKDSSTFPTPPSVTLPPLSSATPSYVYPTAPSSNSPLMFVTLKPADPCGSKLVTVVMPGINGTLVSSTLATIKGLDNMTYNIFVEETCGWVIDNASDLPQNTSYPTTSTCVGTLNISITVSHSVGGFSYVKPLWADECHDTSVGVVNITAIRITCPSHSSGNYMYILYAVLAFVVLCVLVLVVIICVSLHIMKRTKQKLCGLRMKIRWWWPVFTSAIPILPLYYEPNQTRGVHGPDTEPPGDKPTVTDTRYPEPKEITEGLAPRNQQQSSPESRVNSQPQSSYKRSSTYSQPTDTVQGNQNTSKPFISTPN